MLLGLCGGCEFVVHMLNATLKHNDNGDDIHCKANCFQNQSAATHTSSASTSSATSCTCCTCSVAGDESAMLLHMGRDKTAEVIRSLQGVAQGCVLGSMLCAVCITDKHCTPAQQAALRRHGDGGASQSAGGRHHGRSEVCRPATAGSGWLRWRRWCARREKTGWSWARSTWARCCGLAVEFVEQRQRAELFIKLHRHSTISAGVCIRADPDAGRAEFAAWRSTVSCTNNRRALGLGLSGSAMAFIHMGGTV